MAIFAYCPKCSAPVGARWSKDDEPTPQQIEKGYHGDNGILVFPCDICDNASIVVLQASSTLDLAAQINDRMRNGYMLEGNLVLSKSDTLFYQMMRRRKALL